MKRVKMFRGNNTGKNFTLKEFLELVCNTESTKDKRWKADPNLERQMTVRPGSVKMLAQGCKLYDRQKETNTLQTILFKKEIEHFNS